MPAYLLLVRLDWPLKCHLELMIRCYLSGIYRVRYFSRGGTVSASPPPRVSNVRRRLPPSFSNRIGKPAGYLITRRGDKMPLAMFPTCNCMTRSSGTLGTQSESGRKSPSNFLASVTETYAFGAKSVASWFVPRIQDKENAVPSPEAKRRARLTDRSSSPSMYELDMYMYNPPLATKADAQLAAKPKGRPNSPHSPTSII